MPFQGQDIGAPPAARRLPGRANTQVEASLYCATEETTAIAEMRPARGAWLSVCSLTLLRDVVLVDLANPIRRPNPFIESSLTERYVAWRPTGSNVVLFAPDVASIGPSYMVLVKGVVTTYQRMVADELIVDPIRALVDDLLKWPVPPKESAAGEGDDVSGTSK